MSTSSRITADDHGGKIILTAALMLAYTIVLAATNLPTKWSGNVKLAIEDYLLLAAIVRASHYTRKILH
jgi:hypothetical protein